MNRDTYGEVINGDKTYRTIAEWLVKNYSVMVGWTDNHGTHFDILFNFHTLIAGNNIQGGIKNTDLFVSIMRRGAFGFDVEHENTAPGYYGEKLFVDSVPTQEALAELINGVKKELNKLCRK